MADIPHFRAPFTVVGGRAATVEQDSDEDILTCVETILRTPLGSRIENPDLGLEDPAFLGELEIDQVCREAIDRSEPRAGAQFETEIREHIATVQAGVANGRA